MLQVEMVTEEEVVEVMKECTEIEDAARRMTEEDTVGTFASVSQVNSQSFLS